MNKPYKHYYGDTFFRDDGHRVPLVYPEDRIEGPYFCSDCGQTTSFILVGISLPLDVVNIRDSLQYEFPHGEIQRCLKMLTDDPRFMSMIDPEADVELKRYVSQELKMLGGSVSIDPDASLECASCGSRDVRRKMDQIFKCEQDHCPGCFLCGQDLNAEDVLNRCVECVRSRYLNMAPHSDRTPILHVLDLDLHCDGCQMYHMRLDYNIDNETLKRKAY